jgi:putative Mn2+ efflux pump MntP
MSILDILLAISLSFDSFAASISTGKPYPTSNSG